MRRRIIIATLDAGGLDYLQAAHIPNIRRLMAGGFCVEGRSVIPSVTNVNNVSIVTGSHPDAHGITANYWYRPESGDGVYMESPEFLLAETVFQKARAAGLRSALLTSKDKLKRLLEAGSDFSVSAEHPSPQLIERVGPAENIYSAAINHWLYRALGWVLRTRDPDLVYVSTTDYIMHKHAPSEEESIRHLDEIDRLLGEVLNDNPDVEIYITADHGMNAKTKGVDLKKTLRDAGVDVEFVPIIKDRYVAHHDNLGGVANLYLLPPAGAGSDARLARALAALEETPGVEEAYTREQAAAMFSLRPERIGDLFVLGTRESVFGQFEAKEREVSVRSHGSRHESRVPIIGWNSATPASEYRENLDVVRHLRLG